MTIEEMDMEQLETLKEAYLDFIEEMKRMKDIGEYYMDDELLESIDDVITVANDRIEEAEAMEEALEYPADTPAEMNAWFNRRMNG